MSVKLSPLLRLPLLLVVLKLPRLLLLLTDSVDADRVRSCDSRDVMVRSASLNCESNNCLPSCSLSLHTTYHYEITLLSLHTNCTCTFQTAAPDFISWLCGQLKEMPNTAIWVWGTNVNGELGEHTLEYKNHLVRIPCGWRALIWFTKMHVQQASRFTLHPLITIFLTLSELLNAQLLVKNQFK